VQYADIDPTDKQWHVRTYFDVLNELLDGSAKEPALIAIDGHGGSGKTSLARGLAALEPRAAVVNTDDLSWQQPFFDWVKPLVENILHPLHEHRAPVDYCPEAWARRNVPGNLRVPEDASVVFIEGVGSARREMRRWLDGVVWVHISKEVGDRRVGMKGSSEPKYTEEWMRAEYALLASHRPWEVATILVAGGLGQPAHNGRYGKVVTAPGPCGCQWEPAGRQC
jgi:hypothetical protein